MVVSIIARSFIENNCIRSYNYRCIFVTPFFANLVSCSLVEYPNLYNGKGKFRVIRRLQIVIVQWFDAEVYFLL